MQVMIVGLNFVFWAMLPNTIEYGERATGVHVEGTVFGVAALLQRIAIGIATAILGWSFASAGYVANVQQSAETLSGMRATVVVVPLLFLALSCVAMLLNPLGRGARRESDARSRTGLGGQLERAVDALGFGRRRNPDVERARLDDRPIVEAVELQVGGSQREADDFRLARRKLDLAERLQLADRARDARDAIVRVELHDFLGRAPAAVGDPRRHRDLAVHAHASAR